MGALPPEVEAVLNEALVAEFTVVRDDGRPITHPMIPLYDGNKIYMTSSVLFSKKLDHIRRNPKVAVSVTDQAGTHGEPLAHRITVQGDAVLYEDDPHEEWKRIMDLWTAKEPMIGWFYGKRVALPLFFERTLIEITPKRALLWTGGDTSQAPRIYEAVTA